MTDSEKATAGNALDTSASLLEDASTLLMFHNAAVTSNQQTTESPSTEIPVTDTQIKSDSIATAQEKSSSPPSFLSNKQPTSTKIIPKPRINNLSSPGPAIAALAESDSENGGSDKSQKAIVAAAALAAAAGIPLPTVQRNHTGSIDEYLRSTIKAKGIDESDNILQVAQHQVPKDHIDAMQEEAKSIRKAIDAQKQKSNEIGTAVNHDTSASARSISNSNDTKTEVKSEEITDSIKKDDENDTLMKDTTTDDNNEDVETQDETSEKPLEAPPVKRGRKSSRKNSNTNTSTTKSQVSKDYIVDQDSGIISCVCGFEEDDGFTIQCDNCNRWQHTVCMGIDSMNNVPDDYLCSVCHPRRIDVKRAKQVQSQRLESLKRKKGRNSSDLTDGDKSSSSDLTNKKSNNRETDESKNEEVSANHNQNTNNNSNQTSNKPRSKPSTNSYGKNLEEGDIDVLDSKNSYLTSFYPLKSYDYQDELVFKYIQNMKSFKDASYIEYSRADLDRLRYPTLNVKPYSDVNNKKFNGISKLGLFSDSSLGQDEILGEYLGEINFKERYIQDTRNHYKIWGVEKPYVSFIKDTPLVIDARFSGNLTRFIRRSCNPNCQLRVLKIADESIKFVLVATKQIKPNTELTVGWNWDPNHSIRTMLEGSTFDQTSDADKPSLILSIESILTFMECGCTSTSECVLSRIKKASAHIYRSTRKGNSTSGIKFAKKISIHRPIEERLFEREAFNLENSTEKVITKLPILSNNKDGFLAEAEVQVKPFLYSYLRKRTFPQIEEPQKSLQYLPIPIRLLSEQIQVDKGNLVNAPPKPIKKLSFADYKRKKKPT